MKANVPKKLYYAPYGDIREDCPITDKDIEYTRTDAFIEKAEKYLTEKFIKDVCVLAMGGVSINFAPAISNFLKYMKGE